MVIWEENVPSTINTLPPPTLDQLPLRHLPQIRQMIRTRTRNNRIPNARLVRRRHNIPLRFLTLTRGLVPRCCHIDEYLFRVPRKEAGEVGGEVEADAGVFFFLGAVVVRSSFRAVVVAD